MKKSDLKAGMICEVEEFGNSALCMITYNKYGDLIFSSPNIYGGVSKLDDNLEYTTKNGKVLRVYDRCRGFRAYSLDVSHRDLLWERKEVQELTVAEIEKLLGYPIKVVK